MSCPQETFIDFFFRSHHPLRCSRLPERHNGNLFINCNYLMVWVLPGWARGFPEGQKTRGRPGPAWLPARTWRAAGARWALKNEPMTFSTFPSKLALVPFHICHVSPKLLHTRCSRSASAASGAPVQHPATSSCPSMPCQSLQALLWPPLARKPPFCTLRVAEPLFFLAILFYFSSKRGGQESLTLAPRRQRPSPFFPGLSPELISSGLGVKNWSAQGWAWEMHMKVYWVSWSPILPSLPLLVF